MSAIRGWREQEQRRDRLGYLVMAGVGALAVGGLGTFVALRDGVREVGSGCVVGVAASMLHVVVIDRTENWKEAERRVLIEGLRSLIATVKIGERVRLVGFDGGTTPGVMFDACRPERGREVSGLLRTEKRVEREYQMRFGEPLEKALQSALSAGVNAGETHLVGFLGQVAASAVYEGKGRSVVVHAWSDMAENTAIGSFVSKRWRSFDRALFGHHFRAAGGERLKGVELRVVTVATPSVNAGVAKRVREAWQSALADNGVKFTWKAL